MKGIGFSTKQQSFAVSDPTYLDKALAFIRQSLQEMGVAKRPLLKTEMAAEEAILLMAKNAAEGAVLKVSAAQFVVDRSIKLSMVGEEFDPFASGEEWSEEAIRSVFFRSLSENFKYAHKRGENRVLLVPGKPAHAELIYTLSAMVLGLLCGLLLKFMLPESLADGVRSYFLTPINTLFINALKSIIAPVVFFSIASCFSQFNNLTEFGRMGVKVMGMYFFTTLIAIGLGFASFYFFQPGSFGFALAGNLVQTEVSVDTSMDTSLVSLIVGIVPSNFFAPFLEANTLQIIFLAVICGIAVGKIGEYSEALKGFFEACNSLFLTITSIFTKAIPLAAFASMALLMLQLGGKRLLPVMGVLGVAILTLLVMIGIYGLLIAILARLNPITFYRKSREGMLTSLTLSSSNAAMPTNLKVCTQYLGISPKVSNFSIPLGATINMDGTCIYLAIIGLFLARAFGVEVPPSALVSLAVTIILLSLGAPGVPGAGIVCTGIVLEALHVPVSAVGLIVAIAPIIDMFSAMSNTTGDVMTALVVAKSEKLLDEEVFNDPTKC